MATTYKRICIDAVLIVDEGGQRFELSRGEEVITSADKPDGTVNVFAKGYWAVPVPIEKFAGARKFT